MKYFVYSVRDVKSSFATPFVDVSDDSAIRGFRYAFTSDRGSIMKFSASDFSLYRIGEFNSDTGVVTSYPIPEHVIDASNFVSCEVDYEK